MEAKKSKTKDEVVQFDSTHLLAALGSTCTDGQTTMAELLRLKKYLNSKGRVLSLLETNRSCFRALLTFIPAEVCAIFGVQSVAEKDVAGEIRGTEALREAISLVANACYLSLTACTEIRVHFDPLSRAFTRLLECRNISLALHSAILRLIGNVCLVKETAIIVALHSNLMDRVAVCTNLDNDDEPQHRQVEDAALRVLYLVSKQRRLTKYVILADGAYHIAKYLVRHHKNGEDIFTARPDLLQSLSSLLYSHSADTGRQLANCSECISLFLQFLLRPENNSMSTSSSESSEQRKKRLLRQHWTEFILHCVDCSHEVLSGFGLEGIRAVLERSNSTNQPISDTYCRLLCCYTKDVRGRVWLRETGALHRVLCRLDCNPLNGYDVAQLRIQSRIVAALPSLLCNDEGLTMTIKHPNFLPTALAQIELFLAENGEKCNIEVADEQLLGRGGNLPVMPIEQRTEKRKRSAADMAQPLCKNFSNPHSLDEMAAATSPSTSSWSPSRSPSQFTSQFSPTASPSASPPHSFQLDDYLVEENGLRPSREMSPPLDGNEHEFGMDVEDEQHIDAPLGAFLSKEELIGDETAILQESNIVESANIGDKQKEKALALRRSIVNNFLRLIAQFSHKDERQSVILLKPDIILTMIRHISEAPELDNRLARALRRLGRHETGLQALLDMEFQYMIVTQLIRRRCTLSRFARPCARCEIRHEFGRRLLEDHALLADSAMGEHILLRLRMDAVAQMEDGRRAETARLRAIASSIVLFRREERRPRFFRNFQPLETILSAIGQLARERLDEQSEEGQLCCELLVALASLLPRNRHLFNSDSMETTNRNDTKAEISEHKCVLDADVANYAEETLKFRNKWGRSIIAVPKRKLCAWNEYFSGMFGSEFVERLTGRDQFVFDADHEECTEADFVKFLHYSIGCGLRSECLRVESAESCCALLCLADKYLCTRLLDHLLGGGIAGRFVVGRTLRHFLPLALSVPTVGNGGGLKNICAFVFLLHATNAEMLSTLRHLADCTNSKGLPFLIDSLISLLHEFLLPFSNPTRAHLQLQY